MDEELWAALSSRVERVRNFHALLSRDMEGIVTTLHDSARQAEAERNAAQASLAAYREVLERRLDCEKCGRTGVLAVHGGSLPEDQAENNYCECEVLARELLISPDPARAVTERLEAGEALAETMRELLKVESDGDELPNDLDDDGGCYASELAEAREAAENALTAFDKLVSP